MKMRYMNKRGQEGLSMNTIIIAIIGIIVLLLIVTFFTGGMSTIFNKVRGVFGGGTAGYDIDLAKTNCQAYCGRAKLTDTNPQPSSTYCTQEFDITKTDGSGETEKLKCTSGSRIHVPCLIDNRQLTC